MEILRVENLCKNYKVGDNVVKALDGVSFSGRVQLVADLW